MACLENIPPGNGDSEMEEGEIVDDLDDLSDISSEEEFLLRQRLQVLENYNNVLERKKAKGSSWSGKRRQDPLLHDLSEISGTDLDETVPRVTSKANIVLYKNVKDQRHFKPHYKQKKKKDIESHNLGSKNRDVKKKGHRKKRLEVKVISESSEESDDEYRNKRRKLANAVKVHRDGNDKSSLQARLQKMINGTKHPEPMLAFATDEKQIEIDVQAKVEEIVPTLNEISKPNFETRKNEEVRNIRLPGEILEIEDTQRICELIDLCAQDDIAIVNHEKPIDTIDLVNEQSQDTVDSNSEIPQDTVGSATQGSKDNNEETKKIPEGDSDEDLELLRQHALKTKASKPKKPKQTNEPGNKPLVHSEDEDSDTAELRLICLKSALLKKAIEMKRKQKLQKRLSQSSNLQDELYNEQEEFLRTFDAENNNTDIESVDMDIGSDGDEKVKELPNENSKEINRDRISDIQNESNDRIVPKVNTPNEDEFEEDEDLLRARLLTSLSKNLPNLVDPTIIESIDKPQPKKELPKPNNKNLVNNVPDEKRIIINLGESDSEGEHEATKNLTKMHMKLSEQVDFQQKLDMFLKSTRMEVEKKKLPDVIQKPPMPKTPEKFIAKAVNHLPKSEQIEYKNLVKRMAELEKIKQARQITMVRVNEPLQVKDTLKPRNISSGPKNSIAINNLEEQIALSRKNIAEESARMLKLKEEANKLIQKHKIVQTELRNITTAITLNKKEQRTAQNRLSKIRLQHQRLLNSSTSKHSSINGLTTLNRLNPMALTTSKLQKENNPSKEEYKDPAMLKSMKISIVNNLNEEKIAPNTRLSIQVDISNNKKTVKMPGSVDDTNSIERDTMNSNKSREESDASLPVVEKGGGNRKSSKEIINSGTIGRRKEFDDYESPLQALGTATWDGDPNAILCPFVVGGDCKDSDCQYLHPKVPLQ